MLFALFEIHSLTTFHFIHHFSFSEKLICVGIFLLESKHRLYMAQFMVFEPWVYSCIGITLSDYKIAQLFLLCNMEN